MLKTTHRNHRKGVSVVSHRVLNLTSPCEPEGSCFKSVSATIESSHRWPEWQFRPPGWEHNSNCIAIAEAEEGGREGGRTTALEELRNRVL